MERQWEIKCKLLLRVQGPGIMATGQSKGKEHGRRNEHCVYIGVM